MDEQPENMPFSDQEVETLAEYEHKKFSLEKKEAGWKYGVAFDEEKKIVLVVGFPSIYKQL